MAFAQQHRRPQHRYRRSPSLGTDDLISDDYSSQAFVAPTSLILSPRAATITTTAAAAPPTTQQQQPPASSDSDNDWHVISSAAPSRRSSTVPRRDSASSALDPSDTSSSVRQSDTESFSDIDTLTSSVRNVDEFTTLPAHDGTGTFLDEPGYFSDGTNRSQDEADSPSAFARVVHRMLDNRRGSNSGQQQQQQQQLAWRAQPNDFAPESASMPNILLPHGGITIPSFALNTHPDQQQTIAQQQQHKEQLQQQKEEGEEDQKSDEYSLPSFRPTVPAFPINDIQSQSDTSASHNTSLSNDVKFTRRRRRNLDSIPSHHPAIPGTIASAAVLSAIWDQIRRITTNLLENDANTSDTFTNLVSEAALEGCMPFGSHLHMDFGGSFLSAYPSRKRVETWYDLV
ncbi:hypothetical protein BDB00DRAFT_475616 [Zychaea mexicana]|uniref:uncharacterized protein n=1 Tax=Zychaea mexicana TaxID=64656 RepID=UPI0022FF179C|nr:uncharacterized protein BDB00DRAFT_475616 [Zychaea mexicana]KAI9491666.1 hypothetical protein BDB00DRAFT_475616 [Zychaea mexicana]